MLCAWSLFSFLSKPEGFLLWQAGAGRETLLDTEEEKKEKKPKKLRRSHVLLAQWASLGFHQIRVGETGRQGADEDSVEEKPSSPSAAPPLL